MALYASQPRAYGGEGVGCYTKVPNADISRGCICVADAIDNGQNKKAVQMVDKILKKQDTMHCAKVRHPLVRLALPLAWAVVDPVVT